MSSYQIIYDPINKRFADNFPLVLENLVSREEFSYIISQSNAIFNQYFSSWRNFSWILFSLILLPSLGLGILVSIALIFCTPGSVMFFITIILAPLIFLLLVLSAGSLMLYNRKKKELMGMNELSDFLKFNNRERFLSRGIQFLARFDTQGRQKNRKSSPFYFFSSPLIEVNISRQNDITNPWIGDDTNYSYYWYSSQTDNNPLYTEDYIFSSNKEGLVSSSNSGVNTYGAYIY